MSSFLADKQHKNSFSIYLTIIYDINLP